MRYRPVLCALLTIGGLSLSACALPPEDESSAADEQGNEQVSAAHFSFGAWSSGGQGPASNVDFLEVSNWVLADGVGDAQAAAIQSAKAQGKAAYVYFYIAAGMAKKALGIDDCNVTDFDHSLCKWGGDYISKNTDAIVAAHAAAAKRVQQIAGSASVLVHVEPDWYQYTQTMPYGKPAVHPLSFAESGAILNRIIGSIHDNCSSCKVVLHASPWAGDLRGFFAPVNMAGVQFIGLVGKRLPATTDKINNYTYGDISSITGRKIIVNTSHGPGGVSLGYDASWDSVASIDAMRKLGVIGVIQDNSDKARYQAAIARYKSAEGSGSGSGSGGTANFSFAVSPHVNAWWIQVHVTPPAGHKVSSVTASVNGATYPLTLQTYGDWAKSPSSAVPAGARVVFTARDEQGVEATLTSQPWPSP